MRQRLLQTTTLFLLSLLLFACSNSAEPTKSPDTDDTRSAEPSADVPEATAVPTIPPIPTPAPATAAEEAEAAEASASETTDAPAQPAGPPPIVVGSKDFTEQQIIGSLMVALLRANNYNVVDKVGLGGTMLVREALESAEINLYAEYNGTGLSVHQGIPSEALPPDSDRTFQLARTLDQPNGLIWLDPAEFNNTYTMMVRPALVEQGVASIDDLSAFIDETGAEIRICVEAEFYGREGDGLQAMIDTYGLNIAEENIFVTSTADAYSDLREGKCDVAEGFATDARISAWGFTNLADTQNFFPFYNPAPVLRAEIVAAYPHVVLLLNQLFETLDGTTMSNLNAQVDLGPDGEYNTGDEQSPMAVAEAYLERAGLFGDLPEINIGLVDSPELSLLANLSNRLLGQNGFDTTLATYDSPTAARDALLAGELDLIWENTADALATYHNLPFNTLPSDGQSTWTMAQSLDRRYSDIAWLSPAAYENRWVAIVKPDSEIASVGTLDALVARIQSGDDTVVCTDAVTAGLLLSADAPLTVADLAEDRFAIMAEDEVYDGLRDDVCSVALGRNTDARITAYGFVRLSDSGRVSPVSSHAPVMRRVIAEQFPEIDELHSNTLAFLDEQTISTLLAQATFGPDGVATSGDEDSAESIVSSFINRTGVLENDATIVIGAQNSIEQTLLSALTARILREDGYNVVQRDGFANTEAAYTAITQEEIDLYWSYTGGSLSEIHILDELPTDPDAAWEQAQTLDQEIGLTWLPSSAFNDTYALLVLPDRFDVTMDTIEDLATYMNENDSPLSICVEEDFVVRSQGLSGMQEAYGFAFREENIVIRDFDDLYNSLISGDCAVAEGFRTDGRVATSGMRALEDTLQYFPAFNAAPIVRAATSESYPTLSNTLGGLAGILTNDVITGLNARIGFGADGVAGSGDEESLVSVTDEFLCEFGLIANGCSAAAASASADSSSGLRCETVDINGGFEDDRTWRTPITRSAGEYSNVQARSGAWSMQLGARGRGASLSYSIAQTLVTIPVDASSAEISFWHYPNSLDVLGGDSSALYIYDEGLTFAREIFEFPISGEAAWSRSSFNLSGFRGDSVQLHFLVINDGDGIPSTTFIDDVELQFCYDN